MGSGTPISHRYFHHVRKDESMKDFYNSNTDFKEYVERYCKKHKCTVEEALKHKVVEDVCEHYKEHNKSKS